MLLFSTAAVLLTPQAMSTVDQFAAAGVIVEAGCIGRRLAMVMGKSSGPRAAACSNVTTSRNAPNELERLTVRELRPAGSAEGAVGAPPQALLDAVEDQRIHLLNVLGIVHSMGASFADAVGDPALEICAAFALLEEEIRRVAAGLEEGPLRSAT
jgi:hypothetical protein